MLKVLRLVFRSAQLMLLAFIIQAWSSNNLTSTTYSKDGLSFKLPVTWDVFIETMRAEYQDFVVYFTFSSQALEPECINNIDSIIKGFEFKKDINNKVLWVRKLNKMLQQIRWF